MGTSQPTGGQAPVTTEVTGRRVSLASPVTATVLAALALALAPAEPLR